MTNEVKKDKYFPKVSSIKGWLGNIKTKFLVLINLIKLHSPLRFIKIKFIDLLIFALFYPPTRLILGSKKGYDICNDFVGLFCPSAILPISSLFKSKIMIPSSMSNYGPYFEILGENKYHHQPITKRMKVVDIGANIGVYTVLAAEKVGERGRVIAIEPEPKNYKLLLENIKLNKFQNVTPVNTALSDHQGWEKLYLSSSDSGGHSLIFPEDRNSYTSVQVKTLDELLEELDIKKIDLIKIDTEGAEIPILKGAEKTLKINPNIKLMIAAEHYPSEIEEVRQFLNERGFKTKVFSKDVVMTIQKDEDTVNL